LAVGYTSKWIKHPEAVKAEFSHPVTGNFFGTVTIALLLLSAIAMSYSTLLGQVLWAVGSGLTVLLAAVVVFRLLSGGREAQLA
ncbi:C4-dicarboxylate ABC transporter, partial [Salmonella enterica subsp. enterica]